MKTKIIVFFITISFLMLLAPTILADVEADFAWIPANPIAGENVTFYDISDFKPRWGPNKERYDWCSWNWEYTTGNLGQDDDDWGYSATYKWNEPGTYHIDHWVRGTKGSTDTCNKHITIAESVSKPKTTTQNNMFMNNIITQMLNMFPILKTPLLKQIFQTLILKQGGGIK